MATQSRRMRATRTSFYGACLIVLFSAFECGHVAGPDGNTSTVQQGQNSGGTNSGTNQNNNANNGANNGANNANNANNGANQNNNNNGQNGSYIILGGASPLTAGGGPVSGFTLTLITNNLNVAVNHDVTLTLNYPSNLVLTQIVGGPQVTSLTVQANHNVVNYVVSARDVGATLPQSAQITATDANNVYGTSQLTVLINPAPGSNNGGGNNGNNNLASSPTSIVLGAPASVVAGTCATLTVTPKLGTVVTPFPSNAYVTFFADKHGEFFSDNHCATSLENNTARINGGATSLTVYYMDMFTELDKVTAVADGLPDNATINVIPGAPSSVAVKGGQSSFSVGPPTCAAFTAVIMDSNDNPSPVSQTTEILLRGIQSFYSDAICSAVIDSVTLAPGSSTGVFYVASSVPGLYNLTPSVPNLTSKPMPVQVTAGSANRLVLAADPPDPSGHSTVFAGNCLRLKVSLQDMYGNPTSSASNTNITIGGLGQGQMFSSNDCSGSAITSTTIPAANSSATLSFRDTKAESVTPSVTASNPGINSASYPVQVVAGIAAGFNVIVPNGGTATAGVCSAAIILNFVDQYGNLTKLNNAITIGLNVPTAYSAKLFSDWQCAHQVTSIPAALGDASASFYLKDNVAEAVAVGISATGFAGATAHITVGPGPVAKLAITAPAVNPVSGLCSQPATVTAQDTFGNPAVIPGVNSVLVTFTIALVGGGAYAQAYSDPGCTSAVSLGSPVQIPAQTSSANFYLMGNTAGVYNITPNTNAAGYGNPLIAQTTILAGNAVSLGWTGPASGRAAGPASGVAGGTCSSTSAFQIVRKDGHGNAAPSSSAAVVYIPRQTQVFNSFVDGRFYTDSSCTQALPYQTVNNVLYQTVTIASGQSASQSLYYAGSAPGYQSFVAQSTGYTNGNYSFLINGGIPTKLAAFNVGTVAPGECDGATLITIRAQDVYGNLTTFEDMAHTFALSLPGTVAFADCYNAISSINVPLHSGAGSFYFKATAAGSYAMAANSSGLTGVSFTEQVVANRPDHIAISGSTYTSINVCNNYTLTVYDYYNNPVYFPSAYSIYIYDSAGNQRLSAGGGCGNAGAGAGAVYVTMPANTASTTFSMLDPYNQYTQVVAVFGFAGVNIYGAINVTVVKSCPLSAVYGWLSPAAQVGVGWTLSTWLVDQSQEFWAYSNYGGVNYLVLWGAVFGGCDALGNPINFIGWERLNGCFSPETQITMAGGLRKRADEVHEGDELWNPVRQRPMKVERVFRGKEKVAMIEMGYGMERLVVTTKHPMVTDTGVKMASQVTVGDKLLGQDQQFHAVTFVKAAPKKENQIVYNFDTGSKSFLPEDHMLVSDGIVSGDWDLQNLLEKGYVPKQ